MEITVEIQETPNPNTFKFVLNKTLVSYDSISFSNAEEADDNLLARAIFEVAQSIKEVFITENYITVTHDGSENCEGLKNIIRSKILENINYYIPSDNQTEANNQTIETNNSLSQESSDQQASEQEASSSDEESYSNKELLNSPENQDTEAYQKENLASNIEDAQESETIELLTPIEKAEEFIKENLPSEEANREKSPSSEEIPEQLNTEDIDDQMKKIETERIDTIIDELVRPALQRDGGDLNIIDYNNNVLTISYKGACITCPHAEKGTLNAMQNILKEKFNQNIVVNILKSENPSSASGQNTRTEEENLPSTENQEPQDMQEEIISENSDTEDLNEEKTC